MVNFKQLKIWQNGLEIAAKSFKLVATFPKEEKYGLSIQVTKTAVSIPSNIAEGNGRQSERDYYRFIQIALGSAFELETQLLIAQEINYGEPVLRSEVLKILNEEQRMLVSFGGKLQK
jgi:four helix bundle protein